MLLFQQIHYQIISTMDRQYLEGFTIEQLDHYLKTLKRRVSDMKDLTLQIGTENQELNQVYESLIKQKRQASHAAQKKKKGWSKWVSLGKEKLNNILHIGKPQGTNNHQNQQPQPQKPEIVNNEPQNISQYRQQLKPSQVKQYSYKPIDTNRVYGFDDLYEIGKDKIARLFKRNKDSYNPNQKDNYEIQHQRIHQNSFGNQHPQHNINQYEQQARLEEFRRRTQDQEIQNQIRLRAEIQQYQYAHYQVQDQTQVLHQENNVPEVVPQPTDHIQLAQQQKPQEKQNQQVEDKVVVPQNHETKQNTIEEVAIKTQNNLQIVNDIQNIQVQQDDHHHGIDYDEQLDKYQFKEQNLSQIVQKQVPNVPQNQQDVEQGIQEQQIKQQQLQIQTKDQKQQLQIQTKEQKQVGKTELENQPNTQKAE